MLNSEIDSLQDVLAILNNYNNYTTYIEVSPALYVYLRQQVQSINNFNIDAYPETLYGCKVFVNSELKNYEYRIIRKENDHAE